MGTPSIGGGGGAGGMREGSDGGASVGASASVVGAGAD